MRAEKDLSQSIRLVLMTLGRKALPDLLKRIFARGQESSASVPTDDDSPPTALLSAAEGQDVQLAVDDILGKGGRPLIWVNGIAQRSGTVYMGELIRQHPDVCAYPGEIWEYPLGGLCPVLADVERTFHQLYPQNRDTIGAGVLPAVMLAGAMRYVLNKVPAGRRLLLKNPRATGVSTLARLFSKDIFIVMIRDGRDVVASTICTWPDVDFDEACSMWRVGADCVLGLRDLIESGTVNNALLVRYEDLLADMPSSMRDVLAHARLDGRLYPFEEARELPVRGSSVLNRSKVDWEPRRKPQGFQPVGRWQDWDEAKRRRFHALCGRQMEALGYL